MPLPLHPFAGTARQESADASLAFITTCECGAMSDVDFIEVYEQALSSDDCAAIVQRLRQSSQLQPGRVGGGVHPELKRSRDLRISGNDAWRDVEQRLQQAVFTGVLRYLRRYP